MKELFFLFKYKLKTGLHIDFEIKSTSLIKNIATVIIYSFFLFGVYHITQITLDNFIVRFKLGTVLFHRFLSIVLFIFFVTVNVGNILVAFSTLYKSNEVFFLLSKPIRFENVFILKFFDNFFYSSATLFSILITALISYGIYFNLSIKFYFISFFFLIFPLIFLAGCLGVMILLGIIKLTTKMGIKNVIFFALVGYLSLVFIYFKYSSPVEVIKKIFRNYPAIDTSLLYIDDNIIKFFPNHWVSEALLTLSSGNGNDYNYFIILLLAVTIAAFALMVFIAKKYYYKSFLRILDLKLSKEGKSILSSIFSFSRKNLIKGVEGFQLKRDAIMFFREPTQVMHLSLLFVLILIFISSLFNKTNKLLEGFNAELQALLFLVLFLFIIFLISTLSLRFVFPQTSLEGETLWRIRSAPVDAFNFIKVKYFSSLLIISSIGVLISYFTFSGFPPIILFTTSIITVFVAIGLVSINFCFGTVFSDYKEKNPIRIASSQGASTSFLFSVMFMSLIIVFMYPIYSKFFVALHSFEIAFDPALFIHIMILIASFALIVAMTCYSIAKKNFMRI